MGYPWIIDCKTGRGETGRTEWSEWNKLTKVIDASAYLQQRFARTASRSVDIIPADVNVSTAGSGQEKAFSKRNTQDASARMAEGTAHHESRTCKYGIGKHMLEA